MARQAWIRAVCFAVLSSQVRADRSILTEDFSSRAAITTREEAIQANIDFISDELTTHGGTWQAWSDSVQPFVDEIAPLIEGLPFGETIIEGNDNWLFLQRTLESASFEGWIDDDYGPTSESPYEVILDFSNQLASRGIDLIFVPMPDRIFVYPEQVAVNPASIPESIPLHPQTKRLMLRLSEAGVEVLDLLPLIMEAKPTAPQLLYHERDTHWGIETILLTAPVLADRLQRYDFVQAAAGNLDAYWANEIVVNFQGWFDDIFPPVVETWTQTLVAPDGDKYVHPEGSPILVIGDSNAGHARIRASEISAQLARLIGMDVSLWWAPVPAPWISNFFAEGGWEIMEQRSVAIMVINEVGLDTRHWNWRFGQWPLARASTWTNYD